jgi:hypothetical protein
MSALPPRATSRIGFWVCSISIYPVNLKKGSKVQRSEVQKGLIRWEARKLGSQKAKSDEVFEPPSLPACQPSS